MSCLMSQYISVNKSIKGRQDQIQRLEEKIQAINTQQDATIPNRIQNIQEQLKKIDEYMLKIEAFKQLAEKNLESKNVLTIEAPADYRVNLNRLRNWAMMIDPMSSNDPYAQRVNVVAQCDLLFLERKKEEFSNRLQELKHDLEQGNTIELKKLENEILDLKKEINDYAFSEEIAKFLDEVQSENNIHIFAESPEEYLGEESDDKILSVGAIGCPLDFDKSQREHIKKLAGKFFDEKNGRIYIPFEELRYDREFGVVISCIPSRNRLSEMDAGIRNILLHAINETKAGSRKMYIVDAERQNSSVAGSLKNLEGTFAFANIPRSSEQITAVLEELISSFADIDEQLGNCDSVIEYNNIVEPAKQIERKIVVFIGWPEAFHGKDAEFANRIITNYERYGISFIAASIKSDIKSHENAGLSEYLNESVVHINMTKSDTTLLVGQDNHVSKFAWYTYRHDISAGYIQSLKAQKIETRKLGNEYTNRYNLLDGPQYTRGNKSLNLPVGIDSKDNILSISFDNENFAAYLMGASGSGKSTLIHTLITGILMNYHPDDVELWLADFKMSEFAQYINPLPPHVKYILLDESQELVYDLIDKLTDKMMERQRFFMTHKEMKKVENVPKEIYMPVIFVLFDEFSIMSQAVAESETYKLKLQNLLAKGRALGIKFLFSSQTFTKGVAGLTATAKDQIQSRIAMKNSKDEISETLQLSSSLKTEQVRNWLDALPPHYALYKYRNGDQLELKRMHVMYFKGDEGNSYIEQQRLIHKINARLKLVDSEQYDANVIDSYIDKKPVIVDGNSYAAFDSSDFMRGIKSIMADKTNSYLGDELFISLGSPRLMDHQKLIPVFPESRQNFLLLGSSSENVCMAAVITSIMKSFQAQGANVKVWAYERNKIFTNYNAVWDNCNISCDLGTICDEIYELKEALQQEENLEKTLVVLLGFENLCADFELAEKKKRGKSVTQRKMSVNETSAKQEVSESDRKIFDEIASEIMAEEELDDADELEDETIDLDALLAETKALFVDLEKETANNDRNKTQMDGKTVLGSIYNATEDLQYIATRGSRKGIHLLLGVNSYSDLKQTGLKLDWFSHRMAFQISIDDSRMVFGTKIANTLPEHVCEYTDSLDSFSFRPYIHKGVSWDGWEVDKNNAVRNIFSKDKEE